MVGSGITLDPIIFPGFRAMTPTEMEEAIKNFDLRLRATEQILPTLATKADLQVTRDELLATLASKAELQAVRDELLAALASKEELQAVRAELRRHTDIRIEDVRDDIAKVAEG